MAKLRVKTNNAGVQIVQNLNKQKFPDEKLARKAARGIHVKAVAVTRAHIKHAVGEIEKVMTAGISGIGVSKSRKVGFSHEDGSRDDFRTPVWKQLANRYRQRKPKSSVFWRKHFKGKKTYYGQRPLLADYKTHVRGKLKITTEATKSKPLVRNVKKRLQPQFPIVRVPVESKNVLLLSTDGVIKGIPPPLDTYIVRSMVQRKALDRTRGIPGTRWKGIRRLQYVEERRPFIAGVSAKLGRQMFRELRRIDIPTKLGE